MGLTGYTAFLLAHSGHMCPHTGHCANVSSPKLNASRSSGTSCVHSNHRHRLPEGTAQTGSVAPSGKSGGTTPEKVLGGEVAQSGPLGTDKQLSQGVSHVTVEAGEASLQPVGQQLGRQERRWQSPERLSPAWDTGFWGPGPSTDGCAHPATEGSLAKWTHLAVADRMSSLPFLFQFSAWCLSSLGQGHQHPPGLGIQPVPGGSMLPSPGGHPGL